MRYVFVLLLLSSASWAQSLTETQKLTSLAQVWGFLKYYHPAVATGKQDWDAQLIQLIPVVQQVRSREELATVYSRLLDELGSVKPCRHCQSESAVPAADRRNLDLTFLRDSTVLTDAVRERLVYIKDNRNQKSNRYVRTASRGGNPNFDRENAYADMNVPDASYRLLALFRYWNIIQYFYPYKYAIDGNWNQVLPELIPVFQQAANEQAYQNALYRVVSRIQDSHGFMKSDSKRRCLRCDLGLLWLPFAVKLIDNKAVITQLYADSLVSSPLLRVGTVITHIDGETVQQRVERLRPYVPASNHQTSLRDLKQLIGVGQGQQARLTVEQDGRDTTLLTARYPYTTFAEKARMDVNAQNPLSQWLPDSIGYVNMGKLASRQVDSVMSSLLGAKALIFDLRNYPKGTLWQVARYLTDKPDTFAHFTGPDLYFPGVFHRGGESALSSSGKQRIYTGKVLVLVDEETQSQAEFTTMAFQAAANVILVGSPTAGADGNISTVPLPGGYRTAFSGIGVYYPDGRETQRIGIQPNVLVKQTAAGIRARRDEVLERAIRVIQEVE